jgi:hypothetical protein
MTNSERNKKIIEAMRRQTQENLNDPVKFREWFKQVHGPDLKELTGKEAKQMLIVLTLVEPYKSTNNQRTSTDFYEHAGKEYRVTYGLGNEPLVEELSYDIQ